MLFLYARSETRDGPLAANISACKTICSSMKATFLTKHLIRSFQEIYLMNGILHTDLGLIFMDALGDTTTSGQTAEFRFSSGAKFHLSRCDLC